MNGQHQWVVAAIYGLTEAEARATSEGISQRLDAEHRITVEGPGCYNCELRWSPEVEATPCDVPWEQIGPNNIRVRQA